MAFDIFQSDTGVLRKIGSDEFGTETDLESYDCMVDPVFGFKRSFDRDGEQIQGKTTVLDGLPELDLSHRKWRLDYKGNTYRVEDFVPFPAIGSNKPNHYEVLLR